VEAFASSLGRCVGDPITVTLYQVLIEVGGNELQVVRADDSLSHLFGIVDDDIDDVIEQTVSRLQGNASQVLDGQYITLSTPREMVGFLTKVLRATS
jgi:hypothetical protein